MDRLVRVSKSVVLNLIHLISKFYKFYKLVCMCIYLYVQPGYKLLFENTLRLTFLCG